MIGQENNLKTIKIWRLNKTTPRFILIAGQGERLELAKQVAKSMNSQIVICGKSVEDIRQVMENSYTITSPTVYIFEHGDSMSSAANNAILKITEEPPNNAYFIILCKSSSNTLETIRSRATELKMEIYWREDLEQLSSDSNIIKYCSTPKQVIYWDNNKAEFNKLVSTCENLVKNIENMTGVDTLRISQLIKFKDSDEGYDPTLFITICERFFLHNNYARKIISKLYENSIKAKQDLSNNSIRKESTFDNWLLNFKEIIKS